MKTTKKMQRLLESMARVDKMERGKLCTMGDRPHYNHQSWENGRNVVRYVPTAQKEFVQEAIEGYSTFMKLAEQYADEVIKHTRSEREKRFPAAARKTKKSRSQAPKKGQDRKIDS